MLKPYISIIMLAALIVICSAARADNGESVMLKDKIWAWGHKVNEHHGAYNIKWQSTATPVHGAESFHAKKILMLMPPSEEQAAAVAGFDTVIWQIRSASSFGFTENIEAVKKLAKRYPNIKGVIIDDLTTAEISRGMTPEDLVKVRETVKSGDAPLELWGVLYTLSYGIPRISEYMSLLDVVTLWTWEGPDLVNLEANLAKAEQIAKGKPIVQGIYIYDFGCARPMPMDLMRHQCDLALKWLKEGRIRGAIMLATCNSDFPLPAVEYAKRWTAEVAGQ